ncbi:RRAD and GEM like GTPase 2 [Chelydra serpentina]|uniref:RRAD and GEM like GTPase 2 n=1 Tax=Chelydra serpentina TaxID=8475 RepID=A0A8T1RXJ1_CHESE|nr:RRAD and GEM like GTPase 2 [Chelydra serpentina]
MGDVGYCIYFTAYLACVPPDPSAPPALPPAPPWRCPHWGGSGGPAGAACPCPPSTSCGGRQRWRSRTRPPSRRGGRRGAPTGWCWQGRAAWGRRRWPASSGGCRTEPPARTSTPVSAWGAVMGNSGRGGTGGGPCPVSRGWGGPGCKGGLWGTGAPPQLWLPPSRHVQAPLVGGRGANHLDRLRHLGPGRGGRLAAGVVSADGRRLPARLLGDRPA